ncbi:MAG: hypothetical protein IH597_09850 [Bacteroidales bacterium]|nr:hypothetical protein [Bacteroidales bacterium]
MKQILYTAAIFLCCATCLPAQTNLKINSVEADIDTFSDIPSLEVRVNFKIPGNDSIDAFNALGGDEVRLSSLKYWAVMFGENYKTTMSLTTSGFSVFYELEAGPVLQLLNSEPGSFYLEAKNDLKFLTKNKDTLTLEINELRSASKGKIGLSVEQIDEVLATLAGNLTRYRNFFNLGFDPQAEDFTLSLDYLYSKPYKIENIGLYFFSEGRLSTFSADTLNYFKIYPINANLWEDKLMRYHVVASSGLEADQIFSNARINVNLNIESIIPNLVNLTYGHDRLRLKPVVAAGISYYNQIKVPDESLKQNAFLLSGEIYYYIPVMEAYYFLVHAKTFYDTGREKAVAWDYHASVALGLELKSAPATIIAKYAFGANEITFEHNDQLLIGFAMDLFGERGGR